MGDKGKQDPREGGHTIQQRKQDGRQRETRFSGKRTHHPTKGNKKGYNGRQEFREGGHIIQHQGGHLKKALRTPNSTLFGEKGPTQAFFVAD